MEEYKDLKFDYLIIDEAQNIKIRFSYNTCYKNINAKSKFALTGTQLKTIF